MARLKSLDAYAAYLAMRHARDQEAIAAQLALALYPLWTMMKFRELDASTPSWLASVLPRIKTSYLQSQRVTAVFTQNVRFAALPTDDPLPIKTPDVEQPGGLSPGAFSMPDLGVPAADLVSVADEFQQQRVATSLTIQGNYLTKAEMPGAEEELMHNALVRTSGTAVREAINGSRNVTNNTLRVDRRRIIGYARVTDSRPCYFCALLASRGAVYTKQSFLDADAKFTPNPNGAKDLPHGFTNVAKVHDNCKCTLRPVYAKSTAMDEAAKHYRAGWNAVNKAGKGNKAQVNEFRKWLADHPFPGSQFDLHTLSKDLSDRQDALLDAGFSADSPQVKWAAQARNNLAA